MRGFPLESHWNTKQINPFYAHENAQGTRVMPGSEEIMLKIG